MGAAPGGGVAGYRCEVRFYDGHYEQLGDAVPLLDVVVMVAVVNQVDHDFAGVSGINYTRRVHD